MSNSADSSTPPASPDAPRPASTPKARFLATLWSLLAPFVGLLVVVVIFALLYPAVYPWVDPLLPKKLQLRLPEGSLWERVWERGFISAFRIKLITKQTAIVAVGALGMTVIIISAGIDLAVGSLLALTAVCMAVMLKAGIDPMLVVIAVLLIGTLAGALNGVLITGLRLVPFIVTLGTMLIFRGLALRIADQQKIQADAPNWLVNLLDTPPPGSWQFISTAAWIVVVLAIIVAVVLRYTVFGRYVFALGSNEATARLCGVNVPLMKIVVYAVGGFFMAVAGIFDFSNMNAQGDPTSGDALELKIIAAVVIGGGSLSGGRGSVLGSIIGALTMTTLTAGCVFAGVSDPIQKVVIGSIIIGAVAIDRFLHRGSNA
jgi:ribose transport system permease protein